MEDIYRTHLILFVNKCIGKKSNSFFNSYFKTRDNHYALRNEGLDIDFARTQAGYLTVKNVGSRLWNELLPDLKEKGNQSNFKKLVAGHYIAGYTD